MQLELRMLMMVDYLRNLLLPLESHDAPHGNHMPAPNAGQIYPTSLHPFVTMPESDIKDPGFKVLLPTPDRMYFLNIFEF